MVKRSEKNEAVRTLHGISVKQNIVYDDALIPSAEEMEHYKAIDPGFVQWFMDNGTREQKARHADYNERYRLMHRSILSNDIFMVLLFVAFLVFVCLSTYLIINDKRIEGSIFAIASFASILTLVLRDKRANK